MTNVFPNRFTTSTIEAVFPIEKFGRPNKVYHRLPLGIKIKTRKYKAYHKAFELYLSNPRASRFTYDNANNVSLWLEVGDNENECSIHYYSVKYKHTSYTITLTRTAYEIESSDLTNWNDLMNEPITEK